MPIKEARPYQIDDLAFLINNPRAGLLSDPATGKTLPVCLYQEYLWTHKSEKSVWLMPKSLLKKNYDEVLECTNLKPEQVIIVDGTPAQREKQISDRNGVVFLMGFKRFAYDWEKIL